MGFSRLVVASIFLLTVILVPVSIPESPAVTDVTVPVSSPEPSSDGVRAPEPAPAPRGPVPALLDRLQSSDVRGRRAAFLELLTLANGVPVEAAPVLVAHLEDDHAREGLVAIGSPAVPALEAKVATSAAAAYLLARLAPNAWADRILPTAVRALAENDTPGDARFGVMALILVGPLAHAAVRELLAGDDDQAVACALAVLARAGAATPADAALAAPALRRLALRAAGDEPEAAIEAYAALGTAGETLVRGLIDDPRVSARAIQIWKRCANPARDAWIPAGRTANLPKRTE
jgi:hypothetical protein